MGIFSQNYRPGFNDYTVEAAAGYEGPGAGGKIMMECYQNDMALFRGIIEADFNAAHAEKTGSVQEATVITEGAVGDFFKKIAEMFRKLWAKIKGLIESFMVKFVAVFIRDNKELVKKYHKDIVKQLSDKKRKYDEMEYKMHEGIYEYAVKGNKAAVSSIDAACEFKVLGGVDHRMSLEENKDKFEKDYIDFLNKTLKINLSVDEFGDLKKELNEKYIGDMETYEGYTSALNTTIEKALTDSKETISTAEKHKKSVEKTCKEAVKKAEDEQKEAEKKEEGAKREGATLRANEMYFEATKIQGVVTDLSTWKLDFLKMALKEQRALFIKAVSRRAVNESAELDSIIDEAVAYEVESMFEAAVDADASIEIDGVEDLIDEE